METVLILENERFLRKLYKEELEDEGYRILLAKNDREALKMIEKKPPDLIIANYQTPPTKSYITMLRMASKIKGIPVIINSGYPRDQIDIASCKAIEYLTKSSNLTKLKKKMRKMLGYEK